MRLRRSGNSWPWWSRVALAVTGALVGVVVLLLAFIAYAGGLRIRTPIGEMNEALDRLELPGSVEIASTEWGEHLCFVQCVEWRVDRFYALDDRSPTGADTAELCDQVRDVAAVWFGAPPEGGLAATEEARESYECGYFVYHATGGLPEDSRWCAEMFLLPIGYESVPGADVRATVGIEC